MPNLMFYYTKVTIALRYSAGDVKQQKSPRCLTRAVLRKEKPKPANMIAGSVLF
jgi:hypothetical protein